MGLFPSVLLRSCPVIQAASEAGAGRLGPYAFCVYFRMRKEAGVHKSAHTLYLTSYADKRRERERTRSWPRRRAGCVLCHGLSCLVLCCVCFALHVLHHAPHTTNGVAEQVGPRSFPFPTKQPPKGPETRQTALVANRNHAQGCSEDDDPPSSASLYVYPSISSTRESLPLIQTPRENGMQAPFGSGLGFGAESGPGRLGDDASFFMHGSSLDARLLLPSSRLPSSFLLPVDPRAHIPRTSSLVPHLHLYLTSTATLCLAWYLGGFVSCPFCQRSRPLSTVHCSLLRPKTWKQSSTSSLGSALYWQHSPSSWSG